MLKSQWGIKRNCSNCGTKFYDLLKFPIVCPNCNTEFDINKSYKNNYKQKDKKNIISDSVVQEDNLDSEIIEVFKSDSQYGFEVTILGKDKNYYRFRWIVEKYYEEGPLKDCWLTTSVSNPISLGSSI